jgi:hypothetical protein
MNVADKTVLITGCHTADHGCRLPHLPAARPADRSVRAATLKPESKGKLHDLRARGRLQGS